MNFITSFRLACSPGPLYTSSLNISLSTIQYYQEVIIENSKQIWRKNTTATMDHFQVITPGKRKVLTNIVDFMAKKHPQALFAEFPVSPTSYDVGYRKITYENIANAVNGAAWWLDESLGGPGKSFETLGYMGVNDPRYNIMILAVVKAGYKVRNLVVASICMTGDDLTQLAVISRFSSQQ